MDPSNTRKVYAPYSTSGEQVGQTPLTGYVDVAQAIYPAVNTGQVSTDGEWSGVIVSDKLFFDFQTDLAIANSGEVLSNKTISTYGYSKVNLAIQVSRAGDYFFETIYGGDVNDNYLNLNPLHTGGSLKATKDNGSAFSSILSDQESLGSTNVWFIFQVVDIGDFQFKFKITNQSGGNSDIQMAVQRLV